MKYTFEDDYISCEGKWPVTKKAALKESIKKWKAIVLHLEDRDITEIPEANTSSCALCQIYYNDTVWGSECIGCPVAEKMGKGECAGTPYYAYAFAQKRGEALRAARREVRFLESLL